MIDLLRAGQDSDELEDILVQLLNSPEAARGPAQGDLSAYQENLLRTLEASGAQGRRVAEPLR